MGPLGGTNRSFATPARAGVPGNLLLSGLSICWYCGRMSGQAFSKRSHCQNCGTALSGPYCSECGQLDVDYNRSFLHIVEDGLEGLLHFDGKFFMSARYVFTRPGFLTTEFIAGHRARYANPVRFYVFASFLFFAASVFLSHRPTPAEKAAANAQAGKGATEAAGGVKKAENESPEAKKALEPKSTTGPGASVSSNTGAEKSWLDDPLRIRSDPKDKVSLKDLKAEIWRLLPAMLFFCLPLLALVLKLAYIGSGRLYIEHLIFALHVQALAFLSFIVIKVGGLLGLLAGEGVESAVGAVLLLGMFCLIYRAFQTVYGQGPLKTAFKLILVAGAYGGILLFFLVRLVTASTYLVSLSA